MTPAARVQAAIDILDQVIAAARAQGAPADRLIAEWFRPRRFAGSGDRRAVRELVYAAIRACGEVPASGRAAMLRLAADDPALRALFDGSRHAPAAIAPDEVAAAAGVAPGWLQAALDDSDVAGEDAASLLGRAPLDLRVNALKADRATLALPVAGEPLASPQGLRLPAGTPVESWDTYREGRIEVQDLGSQLAALAVGARPGETVVDLCAGAGGKTLALAADMGNAGRIVACDADRARLARLAPRAERAGAAVIEQRLLDGGREAEALRDLAAGADAVLIDAPCSGTGTWRRNPEARWRLTPARLAQLVLLQARLLDVGAALVRPGGRLVWVVCSVLDDEGARQVAALRERQPGCWQPLDGRLPIGDRRGDGTRFVPGRHGCDGFFVATLLRAC
ncbi:MAG: RsmB/NOP family class I SAM-dependent RNA methyltransferase [Sphingomonadales bacterium]|nr:RsmB/NOP family class I SAM-dependent RNA methyltransferase [Sphingomonadales bacterium]